MTTPPDKIAPLLFTLIPESEVPRAVASREVSIDHLHHVRTGKVQSCAER